jgi:minor extracellular protease Epr
MSYLAMLMVLLPAFAYDEDSIKEMNHRACQRYGEQDMVWTVPSVTVNQSGEMSDLSDDERVPEYIRKLGTDYKKIQEVCGSGTWKDGTPIKIGVVDTGIDEEHTKGDLANNKGRVDFTGSRFGAFDRSGHGTWCLCATSAMEDGKGIAGVAPKAWNYSAKGLGDRGSGSVEGIASGIDWCSEQGCNIISLSLGGSFSRTIDDACKRAYDKGILVFASIGNSGVSGGSHPGNSQWCIGVGAIDYNFVAARFSSIDLAVDITDFGVNALSSGLNGRYVGMSGTSMSCPVAAGKAALLLGYMDRLGTRPANNDEFITMMLPHMKDLGNPGKDTTHGYGWMNLESFINANPLRESEPAPPPVVPPPTSTPTTPDPSLSAQVARIEKTLEQIKEVLRQHNSGNKK